MEKLSVHQKSPKEATAKKIKKNKQIKVVYISNPMRFTASASEFKGLVQQFTGQDSDVAELSKLADHYYCDGHPSASADRASSYTDDDCAALSGPGAGPAPQQQQYKYCSGPPFDGFDDVFTPQVLENLAAFMPSSLYYEPPPPVM